MCSYIKDNKGRIMSKYIKMADKMDKVRVDAIKGYTTISKQARVEKNTTQHLISICSFGYLYHSHLQSRGIEEKVKDKGVSMYGVMIGMLKGKHGLSLGYCKQLYDKYNRNGKDYHYYEKFMWALSGVYYKVVKNDIHQYIPSLDKGALIAVCKDKRALETYMNKNIKKENTSLEDFIDE